MPSCWKTLFWKRFMVNLLTFPFYATKWLVALIWEGMLTSKQFWIITGCLVILFSTLAGIILTTEMVAAGHWDSRTAILAWIAGLAVALAIIAAAVRANIQMRAYRHHLMRYDHLEEVPPFDWK